MENRHFGKQEKPRKKSQIVHEYLNNDITL